MVWSDTIREEILRKRQRRAGKEMISIIIPVHNVKRYIIQCLNSVENQSYKDLEIICVDSSDDGTTEILADYAKQHNNVCHVIDANNSYGYKLNYGIQHAKGEYLGIIDADDWIQPNMYEELLEVLLRENVDFVKSDYYQFHTENGNDVTDGYTKCLSVEYCYSKKIRIGDYPEILYRKGMSIWTGLYKTAYILEKNVCANVSEGASYQDAGFSALSHIFADTFYYFPKAYYMYRIDNANSSVKSSKKYRTIVDEWKWIENRVKILADGENIIEALQYDKMRSYWWNCERLNDEGCKAFCADILDELTEEYLRSELIQKMPWDIRGMFEEVYEKALTYKVSEEEKKNVKISVIVPAYNVQDYIVECLESILTQQAPNVEIVCVDDCSTDNTYAILQKYAAEHKSVKVFRNETNGGLAKTRNVGIEKATGEYLLFVDSDDTLQGQTISELVQYARKYDADIIMFDANCVFEAGVEYDEDLVRYYHRQESYRYSTGCDILSRMIMNRDLCDSACLMMIKVSWLRGTNILFEEGRIYEDCMFVTDCLLKNATVYHTNKQYYNYRVRQGSIMRSHMRANNVYSRICCLKKICAHMFCGNFSAEVEEALMKWANLLFYSTKKIRRELSILEEVKLHEMQLSPIERNILSRAERENNQHNPGELYSFLKAIKAENKYIIYGAGRWAKRLITFLDSQGLFSNISCVMVTTKGSNPDSLYGLPVIGIDEAGVIDYGSTIIIAVRGEEQEKIKVLLAEKGVENVVCLTDAIAHDFTQC